MNKLPKDVERIWAGSTPLKVKPRPKKRKTNKIMFEYELLPDKEIRDHIRNCEGKHIQQVAFSTYMDCITQICFTEQKIKIGITWQGNTSRKDNMKHYLKSILIVLIGALLSAFFIAMMCYSIKLIIEGFVVVEQLKEICVSC